MSNAQPEDLAETAAWEALKRASALPAEPGEPDVLVDAGPITRGDLESLAVATGGLIRSRDVPIVYAEDDPPGFVMPLRNRRERAAYERGKAEGIADDTIVEHAIQMSGGGMHVRCDDPEIERIFPLAEWIKSEQRFGGKVYRRRVVVVEDWAEVERGSDA